MAQSKKYPHIIYKTRTKGKHGISFKSLPRFYKRFLLDNTNLKRYASDPQTMSVIFRIFRPTARLYAKKLLWDWRTMSLKKIEPLKDSYDMIEWKCAYSNKPIMSSMNDFSAKNFVHPDYHDTIGKSIDMSIVESSIKFRIKCEELLMHQQKELLQLFKSNANPRKELD